MVHWKENNNNINKRGNDNNQTGIIINNNKTKNKKIIKMIEIEMYLFIKWKAKKSRVWVIEKCILLQNT